MASSTWAISSSVCFWIWKAIACLRPAWADTTIYGILHRKYQRAKKEAHCDTEDKEQGLGDCWDHDIIDVASRAVIVRVHGPRTAETVQSAMLELKERLAPGHVPGLVTRDEYSPYVEALLTVFGHSYTPPR